MVSGAQTQKKGHVFGGRIWNGSSAVKQRPNYPPPLLLKKRQTKQKVGVQGVQHSRRRECCKQSARDCATHSRYGGICSTNCHTRTMLPAVLCCATTVQHWTAEPGGPCTVIERRYEQRNAMRVTCMHGWTDLQIRLDQDQSVEAGSVRPGDRRQKDHVSTSARQLLSHSPTRPVLDGPKQRKLTVVGINLAARKIMLLLSPGNW